jgi:hypothetical protein
MVAAVLVALGVATILMLLYRVVFLFKASSR